MFKELVLAILLGIFIGFGVTGSFLGVKKIAQKRANIPQISVPTSSPTAKNEVTFSLPKETPTPSPQNTNSNLLIGTPLQNEVVTKDNLTIEGNSKPNSYITAVSSLISEYTQADESGNFKLNLTLDAGLNQIKLSSIDPEGKIETLDLPITYSNAKF